MEERIGRTIDAYRFSVSLHILASLPDNAANLLNKENTSQTSMSEGHCNTFKTQPTLFSNRCRSYKDIKINFSQYKGSSLTPWGRVEIDSINLSVNAAVDTARVTPQTGSGKGLQFLNPMQ